MTRPERQDQGVPIERRVTTLIEGELNRRPPRSQTDKLVPKKEAGKAEIAVLSAESNGIRQELNDQSLVSMAISAYLRSGRPDAKRQEAVRREIQIQAELARVRLNYTVGWTLLTLDLRAMTATAVARECLAEFPFTDFDYAFVLGCGPRSRRRVMSIDWPTSTVRHWLSHQFREVLPIWVTSHLAPVTISSGTLGRDVTSQDDIYLPAAGDVTDLVKSWGRLDGRDRDAWLRDVGQGVVRYVGSGEVAGYYSRPFFQMAIQPIVSLDLNTFPAVVQRLKDQSPASS
ncbi:MAG: hypothetical protein LBJ02_11445 [Bifidobacteriaceae bacterium]|jgi:hypothetical protein|nr:hypothetical protein [Bifidobacteriaceae bacterium]